jgi:hypothetical protein
MRVDRQACLLEVCRYVELNPVRAGMVLGPGDWPWSNYRAHAGQAGMPDGLCSEALWAFLLGEEACTDAARGQAQKLYAELVAAGQRPALWAGSLNQQIFLGDDDFVGRMLEADLPTAARSRPLPQPQRRSTRTLANWLALCGSREEALYRAHTESGMTMTALPGEVGLTVARVSQLIARAELAAAQSSALKPASGSSRRQRRAGIASTGSTTSPHCARCRSAWSISTRASMASAMGVARMPTQGS